MIPPGSVPNSPTHYPSYLTELVGYYYWWRSRGATEGDIAERLRADPRWRGLAESDYRDAEQAGEADYRATQAAIARGVQDVSERIGSDYLQYTPAPVLIGVRVLMSVLLGNGQVQEVNVLVNASPNASIEMVLLQAAEWALVNAEAVWGPRYKVQSAYGQSIAQTSGVAWDNAAVTVL